MFLAIRRLVVNAHRGQYHPCHQTRMIWKAMRLETQASETERRFEIRQPPGDHSVGVKYSREPIKYSEDDFKQLVKSEFDLKRIRLILREIEEVKVSNERVPFFLRLTDMAHLMELSSASSRRKYFTFLFKSQMSSMNKKIKQEQRRLEYESAGKRPSKLGQSIYPFIRDSQEHLYYNWRQATAAVFGQKLVLDCSFEHAMVRSEISSFGTQLRRLYNSNKIAREPFDLYLSDVPRDGQLDTCINKFLPHINEATCLVTKSYDSYLEMFPNQRIIYLSPNSNKTLTKWDPNAVIVIGGIVDKAIDKPLTLAKAKSQRIEHAKLPVGHYLEGFKLHSSQSFAIHVVVDILLELKSTNDWNAAFMKVPSRIRFKNDKVGARKLSGLDRLEVWLEKNKNESELNTSTLHDPSYR